MSNRDVVLIWNYQSPTRFYYAHLSQDNTIYPHNGIFVVDNADRRRIDDQWTGSVGAPPAVDDLDWHDVGLRYDARTGAIAVHVDGAEEPLMTATDTTFRVDAWASAPSTTSAVRAKSASRGGRSAGPM